MYEFKDIEKVRSAKKSDNLFYRLTFTDGVETVAYLDQYEGQEGLNYYDKGSGGHFLMLFPFKAKGA